MRGWINERIEGNENYIILDKNERIERNYERNL
jgi:hypothetical protein